jgi:hypothetical protein
MNIRPVCVSLTLCIDLSSCMTYDPYTNEKQVGKATTGAAISA